MARYCVTYSFNVSGGQVIVDADSKADAEKIVKEQLHFSMGDLENNESLCETEKLLISATRVK